MWAALNLLIAVVCVWVFWRNGKTSTITLFVIAGVTHALRSVDLYVQHQYSGAAVNFVAASVYLVAWNMLQGMILHGGAARE